MNFKVEFKSDHTTIVIGSYFGVDVNIWGLNEVFSRGAEPSKSCCFSWRKPVHSHRDNLYGALTVHWLAIPLSKNVFLSSNVHVTAVQADLLPPSHPRPPAARCSSRVVGGKHYLQYQFSFFGTCWNFNNFDFSYSSLIFSVLSFCVQFRESATTPQLGFVFVIVPFSSDFISAETLLKCPTI